MRGVWKDPVGSNVIAGAIVAGAGYLYYVAVDASSLLVHPVAKFGVPAMFLVAFVLLWQRYKRKNKILVFLSSGGTCRDPMAKAIMIQLLVNRNPRTNIEVHAAGLGPLSGTEVSYAARYIIREMFGKDLLKDHRPELLTAELATRADLILVMDERLLLTKGKTLPQAKTFLLKDFLGSSGDVVDPWPDGKDASTLQRYRECAEELKALITDHVDCIINVLAI